MFILLLPNLSDENGARLLYPHVYILCCYLRKVEFQFQVLTVPQRYFNSPVVGFNGDKMTLEEVQVPNIAPVFRSTGAVDLIRNQGSKLSDRDESTLGRGPRNWNTEPGQEKEEEQHCYWRDIENRVCISLIKL